MEFCERAVGPVEEEQNYTSTKSWLPVALVGEIGRRFVSPESLFKVRRTLGVIIDRGHQPQASAFFDEAGHKPGYRVA